MRSILKNISCLFYIIFLLNGCLKDAIIPPVNSDFKNAARLLIYLEEEGDYINSPYAPSIVSAGEVYDSLGRYLIIDVRSKYQYDIGHIESAINVKSEGLINYLNGINSSGFSKIVIISATGQAAGYYNCLLRLYGFPNSYSMDFGMASWNGDFSQLWENIGGAYSPGASFDNKIYPKPAYTKLPELSFNSTGTSVKEKLIERIENLLEEKFIDTTSNNVVSGPGITLREVLKNYDPAEKMFPGYSFSFYGENQRYYFQGKADSDFPMHPRGTVFYNSAYPISELRSTKFLQTIPSNRINIIYSLSGQLSAYAVAYLRILGYDAKSLLFGASWLDPFANAERNNFPYVRN